MARIGMGIAGIIQLIRQIQMVTVRNIDMFRLMAHRYEILLMALLDNVKYTVNKKNTMVTYEGHYVYVNREKWAKS